MTDFPQTHHGTLPLHVSSWSTFGLNPELREYAATTGPLAITWVANQAVYMPVAIPWDYPVQRVFWINGSVNTTTNVDFGIYSLAGQRIYSTGSTAMGTVSVPQYVAAATPFILSAGAYYFAWTCDNTTTRAWGVTGPTVAKGALMGCLSQSTALPLPATATFVRYIATGVVVCGVTRTASGF